ncbi:hypothetical protein [Pseudoxanthomonas japonensis]|uniref:hypothetical protein n=1 Tax=Pseudoxanthomonas japonensis TaxID=69284 RepID=UPI001BCC63AF|nr:hypothetical protein [Pseudoxanthomonas japonensis]
MEIALNVRMKALALTALLAALFTAAESKAEYVYSRSMVGDVCPKVAQQMVDFGAAKSFFADRNFISAGNKSFTSDTFTYCKTILRLTSKDMQTARLVMQGLIEAACHEAGGSIIKNDFATMSKTAHQSHMCSAGDNVLFMAHHRADDPMYRLNLAEPRPGMTGGGDYYDFLFGYGYRSAAQLVLEEKARTQAEQDRAHALASQATEQRLRDAENVRLRPAKRKIGTRLCSAVGDGLVYIGFVEAVSPDNDKVKISVSDARYLVNGRPGNSQPGGFKPSVIWDHTDGWFICE